MGGMLLDPRQQVERGAGLAALPFAFSRMRMTR